MLNAFKVLQLTLIRAYSATATAAKANRVDMGLVGAPSKHSASPYAKLANATGMKVTCSQRRHQFIKVNSGGSQWGGLTGAGTDQYLSSQQQNGSRSSR